jgi:hypothetical protein
MKSNKVLGGALIIGMALAAVVSVALTLAGCASAPKGGGKPPVLAPKLDELLRKYMGPQMAIDKGGGYKYYYILDPFRFEAFKSELDAGGEYKQYNVYSEEHRNFDQGLTYADFTVFPDGRFRLLLCKADNFYIEYNYNKVSGASGRITDELLRKYMGPEPQFWDGAGKGPTYIYYIDPLRFEAFKAELDGGGEYQQTDTWTEKNRDYNKGAAYVQWAVRPNGEFELRLYKADNSMLGYRYKKVR